MTDDNLKQPGVRVSESLWNEFRQDVADRRGGTRGHMRTELENAIASYIEASKGGDVTDRLRRIENQLEDIDEGMGDLLDGEGRKKNKDSAVSSTVQNRLEKIREQIKRESGDAEKVHESVVNKAIEDNAGSSRPTLERYREMLQQRHIVHEWPTETSKTWWLDTEKFATVLQSNLPNVAYDFKQEYGEEWFEKQLENSDLEFSERGIQ
jgi:hypothetical protein